MDDVLFKSLRLVKRSEWDVRDPSESPAPDTAINTELKRLQLPINVVIFSYTETDVCNTFEECQKALKQMLHDSHEKNLPDIPYNFLVGRDGTIYEGRGWITMPEPNDIYDNLHGDSIEIAHFGHRGRTPFIRMAVAAWDLVQYGVKSGVLGLQPLYYTVYH